MREIGRFIESPNLPVSKVSMAAVANHPEIIRALREQGITPIIINPSTKLNEGVYNHVDMLLHHLGGSNLLYADTLTVPEKELTDVGFNLHYYNKLQKDYPNNIGLNCARVGDFLFCHEQHAAKQIISFCEQAKIKIIPVKQGYAKCSVCAVNDHAIITADEGIYSAAVKNRMDALKICPGYIKINQYDYGFIGGCCGMLAPDVLAFSGNLEQHPDYKKIHRFLEKNGVTYINLLNEPLLDIGGILPLMQK